MSIPEERRTNSEVPGFFKKSVHERLEIVGNQVDLSPTEKQALLKQGSLDLQTAEHMLENLIGTYPLPIGVATNFLINGRDYFVPMAVEEPSIIAAASLAAKLARPMGGFTSKCLSQPKMISQIQLVGLSDWTLALSTLEKERESLLKLANCFAPSLVGRGGGVTDIQFRIINTKRGSQLIVHLSVGVGDSMGANVVTKLAEGLSSRLEQLTGAKCRLRILSNLAVERVYRAEAVWSKKLIGSSPDQSVEDLIEGILDAWALADADPYRAATHNKGIMNGIDAVAIATGNDFRALEAGAHAYAAFNREYGSLTTYEKTPEGDLKGIIEIPLSIATAGGVTQTHPIAKISKQIMNVQSSDELACVIAAVGLAQNFAALRALASSEGILKGHMKLHAKNIAIMGGAKGNFIDVVASIMAIEGNISTARAKELVFEMCHVM